jgi:hypothetical protein
MNTDTEKIETNSKSVFEKMIGKNIIEKHKLMEELWEYCKKYPNDSDLGKNLRMFILTQT